MIKYSAPAKVIISGEHVVLFGKPALVSSINLRLESTITEEKSNSRVNSSLLKIDKIVKKYLKIQNREAHFGCKIISDIPIGRGLGSSAAFSTAVTACLLEFYSGKQYSSEVINNLAHSAEKIFHSNPSGVDTTASSMGGLIYYRKEFEFLRGIFRLNFKIPQNIEEKLFLIDTGKPVESTATMISIVSKAYNKNPKKYEEIMSRIEKITKRIVRSFAKEDLNFFSEQIYESNLALQELGVVSDKATRLLKELSPFGAGKITGAGGVKNGSGFALFLADDIKSLQEYCKTHQLKILKFKQSHEGVKKL